VVVLSNTAPHPTLSPFTPSPIIERWEGDKEIRSLSSGLGCGLLAIIAQYFLTIAPNPPEFP